MKAAGLVINVFNFIKSPENDSTLLQYNQQSSTHSRLVSSNLIVCFFMKQMFQDSS